MDDCIYFTNRTFENGRTVAWVFKKECAKCKGGLMIKPIKKGKPDKKSPFYVCTKCNNQEENSRVEGDLTLNVEYTCPHCQHEAESASEYKRKIFEGVPSYVFECEGWGKSIGITKKLKNSKSKKVKTEED